MVDYLGLGAAIIDTSLKKEILLIGMIRMTGPHSAEYIKIAIESILNELDFNKG